MVREGWRCKGREGGVWVRDGKAVGEREGRGISGGWRR